MTPNPNTREGFKYWDMFCELPRFSFWRGDEDEKGSVIRVPDPTGKWLEYHETAKLVDGLQEEINELQADKRALMARLEMRAV